MGSGANPSSFEKAMEAAIMSSSSSSIRATGMPAWIVWITELTAPSSEAKEQVAAAIEPNVILAESRRASDEILRLATTDSLTGLPNRALFQDRLNQSVLLAQRAQQTYALLFADLDHFKEVNDTLGHAVGDQLLIVIAHRLRDAVRDMDTVARLGGDEFVMLLPNISRAHALDLAERGLPIRANMVHPGAIRTPMYNRYKFSGADTPENIETNFAATHPMNRIGEPDEVARAVVFLASDDASFTTGCDFTVDGGGSIRS